MASVRTHSAELCPNSGAACRAQPIQANNNYLANTI